MFYVNTFFESFQGEGNCIGVSSLFIRFHFCNLTCHWCDTKYTWHNKSDDFQLFSAEELKEKIKIIGKKHIILTGGEPLLYSLDKLAMDDFQFHVETNGTFIPTESLDFTHYDGTIFQRDSMDENIISKYNWIVSPKLSNAKQEINDEAIRYFAAQSFATFKFIVDNKIDLDEVNVFVKRFNLDKNKIYISLQGSDLKSQQRVDIVDAILENGYHYSPRAHVILWGDRRDV